VEIDERSPLANKTIREVFAQQGSRVGVAAIIRSEQVTVSPSGKTVMLPGDTLVLIGSPQELARIESKLSSK